MGALAEANSTRMVVQPTGVFQIPDFGLRQRKSPSEGQTFLKIPHCLQAFWCLLPLWILTTLLSDSVKRHLRGRHLSVLNLKFDFISDGGCTREEQIALSLKRHLFLHGGREPKAFWICFSRVRPPSETKSNFKFKTLKRHLLKRHLTLSDLMSYQFEKRRLETHTHTQFVTPWCRRADCWLTKTS